MIIFPKDNIAIRSWFQRELQEGTEICLPEISDYEVRRGYLHKDLHVRLERLDQLKRITTYLPINTAIMKQAAHFWAQSKKRGHPTADPKELDADVILAAQATEVDGIVITDNIGHIGQFIEAKRWTEMK